MRLPLALAACVVATPPAIFANARDEPLSRTLQAHVNFLGSDLLEGRAAGTRGHQLAMAYVTAQFQRLGIEPAGTDGYQQPVSLRESQLEIEAGRLSIRSANGGDERRLIMLTEAIVRPALGEAEGEATAPAVFVGFGIHAPEFGYDDFGSGGDVRGKVAVILAGSPAKLPATARAHYSRQKSAELARRGAVAVVSIETPQEEARTPWAVSANRGRFPTMRLIEPDGSLFEAFPSLRATAAVSRAAGAALFAHAPTSLEAAFAAAARSEPQAFPLNAVVALAGRAAVKTTESANVLGRLPGSDPARAGEPLVITAHLDHLGIGQAVKGDTLYNGVLDNALGTAVVLAIAENLAAARGLARPILFASLTAEEKGLLGAYHLSRRPPPGVTRYAANLNIDMPLLLAPTRDVIGLGAEHSTLGNVLHGAAAKFGFMVSPDPNPEEVYFVRSDQYPFVRAGVPALSFKVGTRSLDPAIDLAARQAEFRRLHYHQPSDDFTRTIDWPSAAAFAQLATEIARAIAADPTAPSWLPGDFFGTRFGPSADRRSNAASSAR